MLVKEIGKNTLHTLRGRPQNIIGVGDQCKKSDNIALTIYFFYNL